ncbi:class F sortase [Dactylosporangium aurantiacum]|uniref:Class F sortase n=1 Tax=Dactylosporangium aurantiacum TaxID=35754 RepID=A0A9Q9IGN3_9ACTN|nr:class F sortase [Dactylosporangium aurantiacum]MDG6102708.1 class F sortase [Dactylosporangium aurantiacum]UWZ53044.1 class F sortase [Dactylosporangium aurantiacum]
MVRSAGHVVRHRAVRLSPGRRRTLTLLACVLALAAPVYAGTAALVGRRLDIDAGGATWIVPHRIELEPGGAEGGAAGAPPTRLRIAALGVDTGLERLAVDGTGQLQSPKVYEEAGWFAAGTAPGDPGPAVLAGHVDSRTGPAVFYKLHELDAGDRIEVQRGGVWLTFTVTAREHYAKARFPSDRVYGPTPLPELRLITCGGDFDAARHSYRDNVVVYAVLANV